eukprot:gene1390-1603_t
MFDEEIFIICIIFIDRLKRNNQSFQINLFNIHRLVVSSALLASKYQNEKSLDNRYYAQVGGISLGEINALELRFLTLLDHNLFIRGDEFDKYYKIIQKLQQ